MNKYWTIEEFREVVKNSKTIREVLRHFGLPKNQGHYNRMFHKTVKDFDIDISHIIESVKTQSFREKIPLDEFFVMGVKKKKAAISKRDYFKRVWRKTNVVNADNYLNGTTNHWYYNSTISMAIILITDLKTSEYFAHTAIHKQKLGAGKTLKKNMLINMCASYVVDIKRIPDQISVKGVGTQHKKRILKLYGLPKKKFY